MNLFVIMSVLIGAGPRGCTFVVSFCYLCYFVLFCYKMYFGVCFILHFGIRTLTDDEAGSQNMIEMLKAQHQMMEQQKAQQDLMRELLEQQRAERAAEKEQHRAELAKYREEMQEMLKARREVGGEAPTAEANSPEAKRRR